MTDKRIIEVNNLTKIFGKNPTKALSFIEEGVSKDEIFEKTKQTVGLYDVSFNIKEGEIFVLMGLSGSGKSTLLRCLNRLIEPTSGTVIIDGEDVTTAGKDKLREIRERKMSMVFQNFALLPHRTIIDNVAYGLEIQGVDKDKRHEKAKVAIETVGLKGHEFSKPAQLSGGMQQRVGLARALATDPEILLMDEAFSALDPLIRSEMQDELLELEETMQKTIVFVSHDLDEALKLGDRIALMKDGMIAQIGTAEEILTEPADDYVSKFVAGVDKAKILTAENVMKRPEPTVVMSDKSGLEVALRLMKRHGISSIFVVDKGKRLKGLVTADDAVDGLKDKKTLPDVLIEDIPITSPDTPIKDLFPIREATAKPIAVVNDVGKLVGIIVRGSILGALKRKEEDE
ncbi:MAG: glycine betaine/L-proline ABC transporter ATP-binding protein [Methanosarcinaceae archaeon]|nr:glycine betaine/L-proline ABC transporter ATP-binding protein [Methanosarcinaceae archaeon]